NRGNPFSERHAFSITLNLGKKAEEHLSEILLKDPQWTNWDRTITLTRAVGKSGNTESQFSAGGVDKQSEPLFVQQVLQELREKKETHYLTLDADRSYPPTDIQGNVFMDAMKADWESSAMTRNLAFRPSRSMYVDWMRSFIALESQEALKH